VAEEKVAPIIVIKKKSGHGGHHGGAWKVAYADFVTAMMALFIVLWLLSSSEATKKAIGGYFSDPKGYGKQMGSTLSGSGEAISVKTEMGQIKEKLEQALKKAPAFQELKEHIAITVTGEGLRIELLETEQGIFFPSGQSTPSEFGSDLLERLSAELGKLPNRVLLEGHTDSAPFASKTYSNWELSTDRANAARRLMQEHGIRADQISEVRGFADQRLRTPNEPKDPSNRRISVIVQYAMVGNGPTGEEKKEGEKGEGKEEGKKEEPKEEHKAEAPRAEPAPVRKSRGPAKRKSTGQPGL
jgi:chemotaxis protein MotB